MADIHAFGLNWEIPAPLKEKLDTVVADWVADHPPIGGGGGPTDWADITGKPSTFPAAAPTWASVSGKPTTFAPAAHTHAITDVTGLRAELDSKSGDAFTPEKYGAKGDGTTDDAQAIRDATAAAAGKPVVFTSGKTYRINSALDFVGVDVNWWSNGVDPAVIYHAGQSFVPLSITGTRDVATATLSQPMTINTYRWEVSSTTGVTPGMLVGVVSSKLWYHDHRNETYKSELHKVAKVGAGWIETEDPANDGYDTTVETVTLKFHKPSRARIENMTIRKVSPPASDTATGQAGIKLSTLDTPHMLNVNVENAVTGAMGITESWRPLVEGGYTYSSNDYGTGYGVNTNGTAHCVVRGRKFWQCRRGVDFSGAPIISRYNLVEDCVNMGGGSNARGTTYGWDETTGYHTTGGFLYGFGTHGGADHTTYRNNTIGPMSYAFACRGRDEKIIGNTMLGRTYRGCIVLSSGAHALIEGNYVVGGWRGGGKESKFWQTGSTEGSRTADYLVYITAGYDGAATSDVIVRDNNAEVQYNLVYSETGATPMHLTVKDNRVRFYPHVAGDPCSLVYDTSTTPVAVSDWTIDGNDYRRMTGTGTTEAVRNVNVTSAVVRDIMLAPVAPAPFETTLLTSVQHLDTVTTPGDYIQRFATYATTANGYPAGAQANGRLEVRAAGTNIIEQRWNPYGTKGIWKRYANGATWAVAWHLIDHVA